MADLRRTEWERGSASLLDAARGGWVRMSGFAVPDARYDRQVSGWARDYLRKAQLLASDNSDGVLFKPRKAARVTAVGADLRRWLVDEPSQRFNVFLGLISLMGPRPAVPDEVAKYAGHVRRRLVVKPGLTGLWQVSGPSKLSWEESVGMDLRYVENRSFALDLQILRKTISALVRRAGAY